jgi:S1-C subfamily serine protease
MHMSTELLDQLSDALAESVAAVAPIVVAIGGSRRHRSGILWRPDVVVTSEQVLPDRSDFTVRRGGSEIGAKLAGRDPGSNVAVLRLERTLDGTKPDTAATPRVGALALLVGADGNGNPTGRLGMVHATGPAWHSMAGGRIDALLRLDARLGADEGGPALTTNGRLLGMSTAGPRRRTLVIPAATIERVLDPLLKEGRIPRGWLGVALQPVSVPEKLRDAAGRDAGMMVVSLAANAPAEQAGVLPGDIILEVDGVHAGRARGIAAALGAERIGQPVALKLLRAGEVRLVTVTVTARP